MTGGFPELADEPDQYKWTADVYDIDEYDLKRGGS